jgi:hypothetical protein
MNAARAVFGLILGIISMNATPEQPPYVFILGEPCSLASDFEDGVCIIPEVLRKPRIIKKKRHVKHVRK